MWSVVPGPSISHIVVHGVAAPMPKLVFGSPMVKMGRDEKRRKDGGEANGYRFSHVRWGIDVPWDRWPFI
jgi:hypothetical protein